MSLLWQNRGLGDTLSQLVPPRDPGTLTPNVTADAALRHSAVWAALRTRADLISVLPVDSFRLINGVQVEIPRTQFLIDPAGDKSGIAAWLYATQWDLDRFGNCFGIIRARDGMGNPSIVELAETASVKIKGSRSQINEYILGKTSYSPLDIWHEKQYTIPGMAVGLSPIAYAAWSLGAYLSAQQFSLDWFATGATPTGHLKNVAKETISPEEILVAKTKFKAAVQNRDIFVSGKDWEYDMSVGAATQANFVEQMSYGVAEAARWFSVPVDLIDGAVPGNRITYASISQRNLQLLVINLQPAITRREYTLSQTLPAPRFVKLNTEALLRMDVAAMTMNLNQQVTGRLLAPSEARGLLNRTPLTDVQIEEFDRLWPNGSSASQAPMEIPPVLVGDKQ